MVDQVILQIKRRDAGGATGAPSALKSGEIAYNEADGYFYVGFGDDGGGNATSIKRFARHDFNVAQLVPVGGLTGQVLTKVNATDFNLIWTTPQGTTYTAGTGLALDGTVFSVDTSVIATRGYVDSGLSGKANSSHTHDASHVTTGTFAADRIPSLDASKVGSGVFDVARIPVLPSQNQIMSSGTIADLTAGQQTNIAQGTIVTTTDGRRWAYSGTGSKVLEASYTVLADITPEWTAIANKPAFSTVALTGAYADLSGRPTLGTLAGLSTVNNAQWSGTDLAVTNGGTGASDASGARTNLGLVIGTNVQAYSANLAAFGGLSGAADKGAYFTGANTLALYDLTPFGRSLAAAVDAAAGRTALALGSMATQSNANVNIQGGLIGGSTTIDCGTF